MPNQNRTSSGVAVSSGARSKEGWDQVLAAMVAVGGAAVLASYVWGLGGGLEQPARLWGGVPETWQPIYTLNMFAAAAGFFLFLPYFLRQRDRGFGGPGARSCFAALLIASALWLPLTAAHLAQPGPLLEAAVRIDLALVGLGVLGLVARVLATRAPGWKRALVGLAPFAAQTVLLDALIWPVFFFAQN